MMPTITSLVGYERFHAQVIRHRDSRYYGIPLKDLTNEELIYIVAEMAEWRVKREQDELLFKPELDATRLLAAIHGQYRTVDSLTRELHSDPSTTRGVLDLSVKVRKALFRDRWGAHVYTTLRLSYREVLQALRQLITNRW